MIVIASSLPRKHNRNQSILHDLAAGFAEVVGSEAVTALDSGNLLAVIDGLTPALLIMVGSPGALETSYREIAAACRRVGACFAFWTVEDPYEFDFNARFTHLADVVFTNDVAALPFYDRVDVHHLPLAARTRASASLDFLDRPLDFFFCGVAFPNRQALIGDLLPIIHDRRSLVLGDGWPAALGGVVANRRISREALLEYYRSSCCVLNVGRDLSIANSHNLQPGTPGPRTFEAAMIGCVQLYHRPGPFLQLYFEPGKEILTFDEVGDFRAAFDAVVSDPALAQQIATAAQRRVLADHTFVNRARTILEKTGVGAIGAKSAEPASV